MANLGRKGDTFHIRFRYSGRAYKRSLKIDVRSDAEAAKRTVELTIHRLHVGLLSVPAGVDPGDFIVSGGTKTAEPTRTALAPPSVEELTQEYLASQRPLLAATTLSLHRTHLNNWRKSLNSSSVRCDRVTHRDLERFLASRIEATSSTTAAKERKTLVRLFRWAVAQGYLAESPATSLSPIEENSERPPFRTIAQIEQLLDREALTAKEAPHLWECLFLSPLDIGNLLKIVHDRATNPLSVLLHSIPAYTGMRRGEVLRLGWADVDLESGLVFARSRKQSRRRSEVIRQIDLHPELRQILEEWRRRRPRGRFVVATADQQEPLSPDEANRLFWRPLRDTHWCLDAARNRFKIGFHTYRHSFASNLAAAGVDQRIIDEFLGHSTDEMRRRYRHLFPQARRSAIESFSLAVRAPSNPNGFNGASSKAREVRYTESKLRVVD